MFGAAALLSGCASTGAASTAASARASAQPNEPVAPAQPRVALFDAGSRTFAHAHPSVLTWTPGTSGGGGELRFYFASRPGERLRFVATCRAEERAELAGPVECRGYTERKISVRPQGPGRVEVLLQGDGWAQGSPTSLVLHQTNGVRAAFEHFEPAAGNSSPETRHLEPLVAPYLKELDRMGQADQDRVERELQALGWDLVGLPLATAKSIRDAVAEKPTYLLGAAEEDREPLLKTFFREAIDNRIHDLVVELPPLQTDLAEARFETLQPGSGASPRPTDVVHARLSAATSSGAVFRSTRGEPRELRLVKELPALSEAISRMRVGERARIWVPEALAYEGRPRSPKGTLVFEVELVDILEERRAPPAPPDIQASPTNAQRTGAGVVYQVLDEGDRALPLPRNWDSVRVHYVAWSIDGDVLDSSIPRALPTSLSLSGGNPFAEVLATLHPGATVRFWVSAEQRRYALAFGSQVRVPEETAALEAAPDPVVYEVRVVRPR